MSQLVRLEGKHTYQNAHCALVMMMIMRMEMEMAANSQKTTYNTGGSTGKGRSCRREVEVEEAAGQTNIQDLQIIDVYTNSNSE